MQLWQIDDFLDWQNYGERVGFESFAVPTVVSRTGSTNTDLTELVRSGQATRGYVLIADVQTAGRGRHGRVWSAPPRTQLSMSFAVDADPKGNPAAWGWLPLLTGVAIVEALRELGVAGVELKWPNDVLVGGKKLGGILVELVAEKNIAVVGCGINVSIPEELLPIPAAISLNQLTSEPITRRELAAAILRAVQHRYALWPNGIDELSDIYLTLCGTLGKRVLVELPGGGELSGVATDIDRDGRIVVTTDEGTRQGIAAGDVTHLRPIG